MKRPEFEPGPSEGARRLSVRVCPGFIARRTAFHSRRFIRHRSFGALQTALYALIVLAAGVLLYHESLTRLQVIGILLAFGGVVLINWPG